MKWIISILLYPALVAAQSIETHRDAQERRVITNAPGTAVDSEAPNAPAEPAVKDLVAARRAALEADFNARQAQAQETPPGLRKSSIVREESRQMTFPNCIKARDRAIAQMNVAPHNVRVVAENSAITLTRLCTLDGSVYITCSRSPGKMLLISTREYCD